MSLNPHSKIELAEVDYDPFAGASASFSRVVPTTEPQREVWLADRLGVEASLAFNESVSLRFSGALNVAALCQALGDLSSRHEALRATVSASGEELFIANDFLLDAAITDCSLIHESDRAVAIAAAKKRVVESPFDLMHGPLVRAEIMKFGAEVHLLIFTAHHIICDGWSFGVLMRDLATLYTARVSRATDELPPAASFGEYALAQNAAGGNEQNAADASYWLSQFAAGIPTLDLPTDRPRAAWRSFSSRREDYVLDAALVIELRKAGARTGANLFATLIGGFAALLHRISGVDDVVIGIPAAGQSVDGLESLVGHCVNLLPLRVAVNPATPARDLIAVTQGVLLDAYEHQQVTFGTLLKNLSLERDPSRLPLVSVMFNIDQVLDANTLGFPGVSVDFASNPRSFENFELFVNAVQVNGSLRLECQYNSDLFDSATVRRWLKCYETLLRSICDAADAAVSTLALTSRDDQQKLAQWNDTGRPFPRELLVNEMFEAQAARTPQRTALTFKGEAFSYAWLDARANRIAHALRARGAGRGGLVGLYLPRGPEMLAAALAVLKSGAAYVPLDPSYPAERLAFMAADASLVALVSAIEIQPQPSWPRVQTLYLDADRNLLATFPEHGVARDANTAGQEDPAYVIYTSGTTGKPKGVRVPHRSVVNFLTAMVSEPGLTAEDKLVAVTTLSFDIAVNELLLPLTVGAEVILASKEEAADGILLARLIESSRATTLQATPATWRMLLEAGWRGSSTFKALCGGEALSADLAEQLIQRTGALWNMYGPTETTVWSTCCRITSTDAAISIGRPIANTSVHVLDALQQTLPIGVPGEIWIGGEGVTLGYLNRPELTEERFTRDRFLEVAHARLYRTGDRGRWRADGLLEHLGRLDFQVKVRGYRIELGEIESCLLTLEGVARAVVIAREDRTGDVRLVAYVAPQPGAKITEAACKEYLKKSLPDYMIPQHFVSLEAIPLLPSGKIDRKALPAPLAVAQSGSTYVAPRTELEHAVAREMEASLGLPGVGIHDDFFTLGGHSLLAAQLTSRLNRTLKSNLTMRSLFDAPTVARLAEIIQAGSANASVVRMPIKRLTDRSRAPVSLMQERLLFLEELYPGRVTYHAPSAHRLRGPLDEVAFVNAFKEMVRRQPSLRTYFEQDGSTVVQRIADDVDVSLFPPEDLSTLPPEVREARLLKRLEELTAETFDLTSAPLFKARMFRLEAEHHVLFFMPHHLVWDGWSFDIFYDEMSTLYAAYIDDQPSPLKALPVTYGDFAAWHHQWVKSAEFEQQLAFWRARLQRMGKPQELPTDLPRRPGMSGKGNTEWIFIDKAATSALHELSRQSGATMFNTLLAAYSVLLYAYSRQTNLIVGTPVRGRNAIELEAIMGYFNNLLPLQLEINPAETFNDLVKRVKGVVVESFTYPDVPLEQLARELSVLRGEGGSLMYQALFSFQDARQRITTWGALQHEIIPLFQQGATEDLGMWFVESNNGMHGGVTYNTEILTSQTAQKLRERYLSLLAAAVANPKTTIAELAGPAGDETRTRAKQVELISARKVAASTSQIPPSTETEKLLAGIWCEQLKLSLSQISTTDNFFDLGGHSLLAMQAILTMEEQTGKRVDRSRFIFESLGQIARSYDDVTAATVSKPGGLRKLFSSLLGSKKN